MNDIAENVAAVRARIADAALRAGRRAEDIRLVAVTKRVTPERVAEAVAAGVAEFGENYVQEAREKIPALAILTGQALVWHLIGHLQSNKAKYSVELFSLIHSVDNYQLAQELGKQAVKKGKIQEVLVEVNLAGGENRAGVLPGEALKLAEQVATIEGLALQGFMGMAPFGENAEAARPHFNRLRVLWEQLPAESGKVLSMGMSGDFEIAVEEGATLVRVGTALFGPR